VPLSPAPGLAPRPDRACRRLWRAGQPQAAAAGGAPTPGTGRGRRGPL